MYLIPLPAQSDESRCIANMKLNSYFASPSLFIRTISEKGKATLTMINVQILLLNERWSMPFTLKERLYEFLCYESKGNIIADTFHEWFNELSEQDKQKITRACLS